MLGTEHEGEFVGREFAGAGQPMLGSALRKTEPVGDFQPGLARENFAERQRDSVLQCTTLVTSGDAYGTPAFCISIIDYR